MASLFSTTATLHHVTPVPSGTSFTTALSNLHNHDLLIRLDPELQHYEALPSNSANPSAKCYKVTDAMHTLPKGLWDTTVTFTAEITDTEDGIIWVIKAPLGLVQRTTWKLVPAKDADMGKGKGKVDVEESADGEQEEWCLVEDVEIKASRLIVGTVKGKCEDNWRGIHGRFMGHLTGKEVTVQA